MRPPFPAGHPGYGPPPPGYPGGPGGPPPYGAPSNGAPGTPTNGAPVKLKEKHLVCDFCEGSNEMNKKTGVKEELVGCSICNNAGHPTCLQFTDNMIVSWGGSKMRRRKHKKGGGALWAIC